MRCCSQGLRRTSAQSSPWTGRVVASGHQAENVGLTFKSGNFSVRERSRRTVAARRRATATLVDGYRPRQCLYPELSPYTHSLPSREILSPKNGKRSSQIVLYSSPGRSAAAAAADAESVIRATYASAMDGGRPSQRQSGPPHRPSRSRSSRTDLAALPRSA